MSDVTTASRPWLRFYEPGVPHTLTYPSTTVPALLDAAAAEFPHQPATVFFGATLSYRTLHTLARYFAGALRRLGVRPGDRVSLHLPNCPQFLIAYYGALLAGAVVVPFNPLYVEREIEQQLTDSGADIAVTLDLIYPRLADARQRTRVRDVIVTSINDYFPSLLRWLYPLRARREGHLVAVPRARDVHRLTDLLDLKSAVAPAPEDPDGLAVLLYTGGTTGTPKGAMLTHRNLLANVTQILAWTPRLRRGGETLLAVIPLFHSYGMTSAMNFTVATGGRIVLLPRFQADMVLQTIARHRPSFFPGVPTIYNAIIAHPAAQRFDLRSIHACISGAAALPVEVQARFESLTGGRLVEGYGLTEASPVTHVNPLNGIRKPGSIGVPIPDTDARVVDDGGRTVGPGVVGELILRGPQVMRGYWNQRNETAQVLRDGWLYTGDMAKMDEDGYFYVVDRKKELIITGGMNVFPREVEEVLYAHPAVQEAAAIGMPDAYKGEVVKAFVVLRPDRRATTDEVIAYCRTHLAPFKVPKAIEFRSQLPKSLIGKILRRVLAEEERARH